MYNINSFYSGNKEEGSVLITAEIGINHQGNPDFARRLIEAAKKSGADAVKFQIYKTENFYNRSLAPDAFELFKSFEMSYDDFYKLNEFSRSLDILFYATPLDPDSLDFLESIQSPIIKVASSDITNEPFLFSISQKAKARKFLTILSTGFVGLNKIKKAVRFFRSPLALLYCVSKYPAFPEDMDLNFIKALKKSFNLPVGFSDHSSGIVLSLGAAALEAKLIERHFTTDNSLKGADHSISLNPEVFREMVQSIRTLEKTLGSGIKKITQFEKDISFNSMRSMYAAKEISKNEKIKKSDILLLRPGNGVLLNDYNKTINIKAKRRIGIYEKI